MICLRGSLELEVGLTDSLEPIAAMQDEDASEEGRKRD
jgi:hypothetical protein